MKGSNTMSQRVNRHPPEQKRAEDVQALMQMLGAQEAEGALKNAQALVTSEPLLFSVTVNRMTRRITTASNVVSAWQEQDVRLMLDVIGGLQKELTELLVAIAKQGTTAAPEPAKNGEMVGPEGNKETRKQEGGAG